MSLSPEPGPIVVDTPPDSPSCWNEDSDSDLALPDSDEIEPVVSSPKKRSRPLTSRSSSKRGKLVHDFVDFHRNGNIIESAPQNSPGGTGHIDEGESGEALIDVRIAAEDGTAVEDYLSSHTEESLEPRPNTGVAGIRNEILAAYVAAVETDCVQLYPLGASRQLFVVQGWDVNRLCAKVSYFTY